MAIQWAAPSSAQTMLTTELNSLATAGTSALGSEWDNTSTRYVQAAGAFAIGGGVWRERQFVCISVRVAGQPGIAIRQWH